MKIREYLYGKPNMTRLDLILTLLGFVMIIGGKAGLLYYYPDTTGLWSRFSQAPEYAFICLAGWYVFLWRRKKPKGVKSP